MDMSLDDYIASKNFKSEVSQIEKKGNIAKDQNGFNIAEKETSQVVTNELINQVDYIDLDYTLDDFDQIQNEGELKNKLGNQTTCVQYDLRSKINGYDHDIPHIESQQWRLMRPNVSSNRPAGMPPLVPKDTPSGERRQNRRWDRQRNRKQWNGNNYRNGRTNGGDQSFGNNYGRMQRWNLHSSQDMLNKSMNAILSSVQRKYSDMLTPARDLTIECTNESPSTGPYPTRLNSLKPSNDNIMGTNNIGTGLQMLPESSHKTNDIKTLLGIDGNFQTNMMPVLASKFLDFLQNGDVQQTVHKPIYDMKVQKEIHEIQKKTFMYECPGGKVVSSDGTGVNNCQILPRSSGISLNCRFA